MVWHWVAQLPPHRDRVAEFRAQALEDGVAASETALLAHEKRKETTVTV
jgi:hypothetical protein